jgi:murein L,D-transpeptidase YafK
VIRACVVRALLYSAHSSRVFVTLAALAGALTLAGCYSDEGYQLPTRAMKELSPEMLGLLDQKNMPKDSPILVRVFKEESELEVWKQNTTGQFQLLKVYPICRWSGELGPKKIQGDRQAPEGFYEITPGLMNPNSNYYLAINIGFPNAYDKANNYTGAFLMIHGDCSSAGCYAMTDEQIGEIYSLARESFLGGQKQFQIQAYPFRLTPANLARHRTNPNMPFWKMLKEGNDHFEVTHMEPKVDVCDRHYVFDAVSPDNSTRPLSFSASGRCPAYQVDPQIAGPALEKQQNDDYQLAQLIKDNVPAAPVVMGTDGGMNRVFAAKLQVTDATFDNDGHVHAPPIHPGNPAPTLSGAREDPEAGITKTAASQPSGSSSVFGHLFDAKSNGTQPTGYATPQTQTASNDGDTQDHSNFFASLFKPKSDAAPPAPPSQGVALAGLRPTAPAPKSETQKPDTSIADAPKPKTKAQPEKRDTAATPPANNGGNGGGVMKGAQPTVPAGTFDGRWAGVPTASSR